MRLVYSIELVSFMKNNAMVCWTLVESFAAWTDEDMILVADSCMHFDLKKKNRKRKKEEVFSFIFLMLQT